METHLFENSFEVGGLMISPVHMRVERLPEVIAAHRHSNISYELHYTHSGMGSAEVGDTTIPLAQGSVYITGPNVVHAQYSDRAQPILEYCLYLNAQAAKPAPELEAFLRTAFWCGRDDGALLTLLESLLQECRTRRMGWRESCKALLTQIVVRLTRLYGGAAGERTERPVELQPFSMMPALEDAFFYHYRELTIGALADMLHLSVRQTQRVIMDRFGKTFSQKRTEARMSAAQQLLRGTRYSVTEIGERVGYSSLEQFTAAFHKWAGTTPGAYRRESGAKNVETEKKRAKKREDA